MSEQGAQHLLLGATAHGESGYDMAEKSDALLPSLLDLPFAIRIRDHLLLLHNVHDISRRYRSSATVRLGLDS